MSSNTGSTQAGSDVEAEEKTFVVKETYQGKQYLEIPHVHMATAGVSEGDALGIQPMNHNGKFCLLLSTNDSIGLSRKLRESRTQRPESLLTIPKHVSTAARLTGETMTYHSDDEKIVAVLDHTSMITGAVDVYNVSRMMMTRWKSGVYTYQIPESIYEKVQPGETVWFAYDVLRDGFIFALETNEADAPAGAVELNVQYTEKSKSDYLVHLPKQICDALELSGKYMKWGHDGGHRILGLLQ